MNVRLTETAKNRIGEISQYLKEKAPEHQARVIDMLYRRIMSLSQFPERGAVIKAFNNPKIREVYQLSYRISYLIDEDMVYVLTVEHMRQQRKKPL